MAIQKIILTEGESRYQIQPGDQVDLDLDIASATFERVGNDLTIHTDAGNQIILENFFVGGETEELPGLVLQDGTEIDTAAFLQSLNPDMDILPAAGPAAGQSASQSASGGSGAYGDDAGALIGGVDSLGTLGRSFWDRTTEGGEIAESAAGGVPGPAGGDAANPTPPTPPTPTPPPAPSGPDSDTIQRVQVDEAGLDDPDNPGESMAVTAPDGFTIVGVDAQGNHGSVVQDSATGQWVYTLAHAVASGGKNDGANLVTGADSVKLVVQDANGNQFTIEVPVDIVDDVPTLDFNGTNAAYQQDAVVSGGGFSAPAGTLNFDFGADNGAGKSFTVNVGAKSYDITDIKNSGSCTLDGEFGKLTIYADGSYNYQANPGITGGAQDSFSLTITDADGDSKTVKLDINVSEASGPDSDTIQRVQVDEAGLDDPDNPGESMAVTAPDGFTIVGVDAQGNHGSVVQDSATGQWVYTLAHAVASGGKNDGANLVTGADSVKLVVQDANGNQFTIEVPVDIVDDVPTLDFNGTNAAYQQDAVVSGGGFSAPAGTLNFDFGADNGAGKSFTVNVGDKSYDITDIMDGPRVLDGEFGKLTINPDGSYNYQANPGIKGGAQDSFSLTITDADGDSKTVKLDITVNEANTPKVNVQVGEQYDDKIIGNGDADIIIGDHSHTDGSQTTAIYNISVVLDVSNSMHATSTGNDDDSRIRVSETALQNMLKSIADSVSQEGVSVNLQLVCFNSTAEQQSWLSINKDNVQDFLEAAGKFVHEQTLRADGWDANTNYESAFREVTKWFADQDGGAPAQGATNKVYFVSDGEPNTLPVALAEITGQIKGFTYAPGVPDGYYTIPGDYKLGDVVTTDWPVGQNPDGSLIYLTLIDAEGNYYGYDRDNHWVRQGNVIQTWAAAEYTDELGNMHTIDPNHVPGEVVMENITGQERILVDAADNYYGFDRNGNWTVLGHLAYGTKTFEEFGHLGEILEHTVSYDKLLEQVPGVEVNSVGFSGSGLEKNVLDRFDNTQGSDIISDPKSLEEILNPGGITPPVYAGKDTLLGGDGNDIIFGDHVYFSSEGKLLDGWEAVQAAIIAAGGDGSSQESVYQFLSEHPDLAGQLADASEKAGHDQPDLLSGGAGNDLLAGQGGDDTLLGDGNGDSAALINGLLGSHTHGMDLQAGVQDLLGNGSPEDVRDFVDALEGNRLEGGQDGHDHLFGGAGNDLIFGMGGNDIINGGPGDDIIFGGSGNDLIQGGSGNDNIYGGSGNDILHGGGGADILAGGAGADTFVWTSSDLPSDGVCRDTILDFDATEDCIDLRDLGLGQNDISAQQYGNDLLLSFTNSGGGTQEILLVDAASQFQSSGSSADQMLEDMLAKQHILIESGN